MYSIQIIRLQQRAILGCLLSLHCVVYSRFLGSRTRLTALTIYYAMRRNSLFSSYMTTSLIRHCSWKTILLSSTRYNHTIKCVNLYQLRETVEDRIIIIICVLRIIDCVNFTAILS